jgi:mono/diheme cytochrome c family protein
VKTRNLLALSNLFVRGNLLAVAVLVSACQGQTSPQPPIVPIRNMHEQPRYDSQERSTYFDDHRTMRPPVPGTVAREMELDSSIDTGVGDDGTYAMTIPEPIVAQHGGLQQMLERGQQRYGIYCTPCHGAVGDGRGMVPTVSNTAAIRPPTFHEDRLRHIPDGQLYATIRNGLRNMPSYRGQIPVADRWAIVAYVRALQLSQSDQRTASLEGQPTLEAPARQERAQ